MSMTDPTNEAPRGGAAANLAALKDRAGKVSGAFDRKQRTVMAAVFAATIGAVLAFSFLGSRTDWAPLMTNLIIAQRAYQANVTVFERARDAYSRALEIGK